MNRTQAGIIVTLIWSIAAVVLYLTTAESGLRINEIGDYIAGAVAPLAFLWFILAYYQQSEEIKANTAALQTQRDEMARQVQAMADQTAALSRTADTLLEHTRPYVISYFQSEGIQILAVLENTGSRPAQHIKLSFEPPLKELADPRTNPAPVEQQAFLAPGRRVIVHLNDGIDILKGVDAAELRTNCVAEYEDLNGHKYRESFVVSHRSVRKASSQPQSLPYAMQELNERVKEMGKALNKIGNKLSK